MKIKSIAAICKAAKRVTLFTRYVGGGVTQYIGDGYAVYPITGLPELSGENILPLFDVPEKQWDDWHVHCEEGTRNLNFSDTDPGEQLVEASNITMNYAGTALKPLYTSRGLALVQNEYLAPITDLGRVEFYERISKSGQMFIAVKAGLLVQAVLVPHPLDKGKLFDELDQLAAACARSGELEKPEEENDPKGAPEQCSLD